MWGVGCIFGEILKRRPILAGSSDLDQIDRICRLCGSPTEEVWPEYRKLPIFDPVSGTVSNFQQVYPRSIREKFPITK
jgi:serine/threonine-protein kinase BUR1